MSTELTKADPDLPLAEFKRLSEEIAVIPKTSQERRVVEVSEALLPAYQKASTLELTDEEIAALTEPFPDSIIEIRPHDGLIFISHIFISNRLNKVFRPGKWAMIRRRDWFDADTSTMYGEYVLLIRGCYVGESVGGHPYIPTNAKTNFSDALESTAAEALRRIAGKRLSCGSQVWEPEYCRQWVANHAEQVNGKWRKKGFNGSKPSTPVQTPSAPKNAPTVPRASKEQAPKQATEATKAWFLNELRYFDHDLLLEYAVKNGVLLPTEDLNDWPLAKVPTDREQLRKIMLQIEQFRDGGTPPEASSQPEPEDDVPYADNEQPLPKEIADIIVPIPRRGMSRDTYLKSPDTIGSLYAARHGTDDEAQEARQRLFGFVNHFEPKPWTGKDGKERPPSASDVKFRESLDAFADWHSKHHPDEKL